MEPMRNRRHALGYLAIGWLVLALFLVKAAIPQGFMPDAATDRVMALTLCSGSGPVFWHIALPASGHEKPAHGHALHVACPFASTATLGLPPAPDPARHGGYRMAYVLPVDRPLSPHVTAALGLPLGARAPPRSA